MDSTIRTALKTQTFTEILNNPVIIGTFFAYSLLQIIVLNVAQLLNPKIFYWNSKPLAWLLAWMICIPVCSVAVPFSFNILSGKMTIIDTQFSYIIATLFISFLCMDFMLGPIFYPSHFKRESFIHHIGYVIICGDFVKHNIPGLLSPFCIMEFPTLVMAIGSIGPKWRSDRLFGLFFFLSRVVFHSYLLISYMRLMPYSRYSFYTAVSFPIHVMWLKKWVSKNLKKSK